MDGENAPQGDCIARRTRSRATPRPAPRCSLSPRRTAAVSENSTATQKTVIHNNAIAVPNAEVRPGSAAVYPVIASPEIPLPRPVAKAKKVLSGRQSLAYNAHIARNLLKTTLPLVAEVPGTSHQAIPLARRVSSGLSTGNAENRQSILPAAELNKPRQTVKAAKPDDGAGRSKRYPVYPAERPVVSLATLPVAPGRTIHPPPFHKVSARLNVPNALGTYGNLSIRGVNRDLTMQFYCDLFGFHDQDVVLVRFTKVGRQPVDQEYHPMNLQIFINDFDVTNLEIVSHKSPSNGQRLFSPIELPRDKLIPINKLQVSWTVDNSVVPQEDYIIFVEKAQRCTTASILAEVSECRISLPVAVSRAFGLLTSDEDGISMNSSAVNLICPLSRARSKLPVRGRNCRHLECFDASSYCSLNSGSKAKWTCPICSECAGVRDLVVDEFMVDLMDFTQQDHLKISAGTHEIVVSEFRKTKPNAVVTVSDTSFGDQSIIFLD